MERLGVEAAVRSTLHRRVDLPSGGYLIFDYAEAFTVIDVNTGRFVGARGKGATGKLEDTITKNNLEAAKEIVRQLRLRDIGGIIVIDFIDMANPKNRQEVEEALKLELERDRTKTYVVEISPLGLVEMTRQNVTDGPREILTKRCPVCAGDGIVVSEETYAVDAERRLRRLAASAAAEAFLVELPSQVAGILIGPAGARLAELEHETGKRFAFETRDDLPPDHFGVLAEGSAEEIEPKALPVREGDELELELEEVHLYHPEDAIARLDGYVVSVADAAGRVGERVLVRIQRATRTVAYAIVANLAEVEAPVEAGVVAEEDDAGAVAAKPRARRGTSTGRARKKPAVEEAPPLEVAWAESAPPDESPAASEEDSARSEEDIPKKRTRRGTRGGRGRKKPAVAEAVTEEAPPLEPPVAVGEGEAAEEKPKKRTRRGSRGGRGRKRVPQAAEGVEAAAVDPVPEETALEVVASTDGASPEGEQPARKRTRRGTRGGRGRRKPADAVSDVGSASDGEPSEPVAVSADPG